MFSWGMGGISDAKTTGKWPRFFVGLSTLVLLTVATNASPATRSTGKPVSKPSAKSKATNSAKKLSKSTLAWSPCGGLVECTSLRVPIDPADPSLGTTRLAIGRIQAVDPASRRGVLFVNPGGPGGSAISLVAGIARDRGRGTAALGFDDWDVVGVDPRGVGQSDPIRCGTQPTDLGVNPFDTARQDASREQVRAGFVADCLARTGPLFTHAGTIAAADDLDRVRVALGETKVDYLGYSYGTVLGAVYASRYGNNVRSMVLDAAVDPARYGPSLVIDAAVAVEGRLRDFTASCSATPTCPYQSAERNTPESMAASIERDLLAIETAAPPITNLEIRSRLLLLFEESANWRTAAAYLSDLNAAVKSPDLAQQLASLRGYDSTFAQLVSSPVFWAVECADGAYPVDAAGLAKVVDGIRAAAPVLGSSMARLGDLCVGWPNPQPLGSLRSTVATPILVIGGTKDSRTPVGWSSGLVTTLGNASLLVREGDGHASIPRSGCVRRAVSLFLATQQLPASNTVCGP